MAFIYFATQIDKCREKVWKKGVEFEEGKKDLSSKGLFPLLKYRPLLGTELFKKVFSPQNSFATAPTCCGVARMAKTAAQKSNSNGNLAQPFIR